MSELRGKRRLCPYCKGRMFVVEDIPGNVLVRCHNCKRIVITGNGVTDNKGPSIVNDGKIME